MMIYRIYVAFEPVPLREYPRLRNSIYGTITKHGISGATIYDAFGLWQGKAEPCFVIEICGGTNYIAEHIANIARDLKAYFNQESVLIVRCDSEMRLIQ